MYICAQFEENLSHILASTASKEFRPRQIELLVVLCTLLGKLLNKSVDIL